MQYNLANLLAAMAILGILSLSLAPLAVATQRAVAVEQAAQQLAQELSSVGQRAVAENQAYYVYFEWGARSYVITAADITRPARRVTLPLGVEWGGPFNEKIEFKSSGGVNQGGTITLLAPQRGQKLGVVIAPFTGRIRIEKGMVR